MENETPFIRVNHTVQTLVTHMIRRLILCLTLILATTSLASAQAINGKWQTAKGPFARIAKCGTSYCLTMISGKFNGRRIGRMTGRGNNYAGTITDPENGKTYNGTAIVNGRTMALSGCVMKIFCRSQTWVKR
jgi:uncharacterized protein (DUF2147 family)